MVTRAAVAWVLFGWCVAAILVCLGFGRVRRYIGRHAPDGGNAALTDLMKEH